MRTIIISIYIVFSVLLFGCKYNHESEHHHPEQDPTDDIHFTKEQAHAADLDTETVMPDTFRYVIKTSGRIISSQSDEITVSSTSNGIVSFTRNAIVPGTAVEEGETLATVSAQTLPDGDPAIAAKIEYEYALKEYERASNLVKDKIISEKEFELARLRYENALRVNEAQALSYSKDGISITTSQSGFVKSILVKEGEYVSVGEPIAIVSQNSRIQLQAEVAESHFKNIELINDANFRMAYNDEILNVSQMNGRLLTYGRSTGDDSFFIPITFEFDNTNNIIPGSFAEVYLLSTPLQDIISVPLSSISEEQGLYFVYIQLDDEHYRKQEVTLGQNDGFRVQILSGLNEKDEIVTDGVLQIRLAANTTIIPDSHSH